MPELAVHRARACLYGLVAAAMLYVLAFAGAIAAAQDPQPRHWDRQSVVALLNYVEAIARHGLDPADYAPAELRRALASGDPTGIEDRATYSFGLAARDLAQGHFGRADRALYFVASDPLQPERVARLIDHATGTRDVAGVLDRLAPQVRQYRLLRQALVGLPPEREHERRRIEVSQRWRWLPRDLGERYLMVNIPEFRLRLIEGDAERTSHRVIVCAARTPTPQFKTMAMAVIFNPPWNVPQSIVAESVGNLVRSSPATARARGYVWTRDSAGRLRVMQRPSPNNALGQVKLDMPHPLAIYVHDTPNKALFEERARTFSHGCIRTAHPFELAGQLLRSPDWDRARIDQLIAAGRTTTPPLARPLPFYVAYMTATVGVDGAVSYHDEPYSLDAAIVAQLRDSPNSTSLRADRTRRFKAAATWQPIAASQPDVFAGRPDSKLLEFALEGGCRD